MKERDYLTETDQLMAQIKKGAFLTVKAGEVTNTMTIGWATLGFIWQRPVFMIAVRDSRYTFTLLEKTDNFTVSIPTGDDLAKALMFCGTKSGRDHDKFQHCELRQKKARHTESPIIELAGVHYECKIIYKSAMDSSLMDAALNGLYPKKDFHTLYFGEILACYETP